MTDDILILRGRNSCLASLIFIMLHSKTFLAQRAVVRRDLYELIVEQLFELNHTYSTQILSQKY